MSELIPLNLDLIVDDVGIVLSALEAIAAIPKYEDVKSNAVVDDFFGPEWKYHEIQYDLLWTKLAGPLKRLRVSLNAGDVELIDCRQSVREVLHELWKWVCMFQPKLEYRLGGLSLHDFDFGLCDDCSAAEPAILYDARRLSERLRGVGSETAFSETVNRTHRSDGEQGEPPKPTSAVFSYSADQKVWRIIDSNGYQPAVNERGAPLDGGGIANPVAAVAMQSKINFDRGVDNEQGNRERAFYLQFIARTSRNNSTKSHFSQLSEWIDTGKLSVLESKLVRFLIERGGKAPLSDVLVTCEWDSEKQFESRQNAANKKLKKRRWKISRRSNEIHLIALPGANESPTKK